MSIITKLSLAAAASLCTICAFAADLAQTTIERIAPYVYPANRAKTPPAVTYMPDGLSYLAIDNPQSISRYETASGKKLETIIDEARAKSSGITSIDNITISPDGKRLLIATDLQMIYRRSSKAAHFIYEIGRNNIRPLSTEHPMQQCPLFAPDSRMVAFVADNNIYIAKLDYNSEVAVTKNGLKNHIINGVPDWTYEEEFATTCSMTWAPDNSTLCFISYDESQVPSYTLTIYEGACQPKSQYALYPGEFTYKYPVAGKPNSKATVLAYDIANRTTKAINLPAATEYVPSIAFAHSPERLMVAALNRDQNELNIILANPKSTVAKTIVTERSKTWIDPASYENIAYLPDAFVMQSPRSGYNHLYLYTYAGALQSQLTSGDYNVTDYYGRDPKGNHYFQSTATGSINRVVSRLDAKGKITHLSPAQGTASASFTPGWNYYILNVNDANTPPSYAIYDINSRKQRQICTNDSLEQVAQTLPRKEFTTIPSLDQNLNAYIIKPRDFNPARRYPVIMWQYSGPGSQEVLNRWSLDWQQFAANEGFVVVCVDPRGTGGRDRAFTDIVYRRLGHYETIDQINAARYVASQPWADPQRIGICGWSYGGYETLMCVSDSNSPFAAAVAIAPVTDWRLYDTVYTERYMLTPSANPDGYAQSAPLLRASNITCPLLIMHGTADDNVHPANSIDMAGRLIAAHKAPQMLLFPNMNHSINHCDARAVVYGNMVNFFKQTLESK